MKESHLKKIFSNTTLAGGTGVVLAFLLNVSSCLAGNNVALGKPYTLSPAPNYSLTAPSSGRTELTDGRYTSGHFWSKRTTVGWKEMGPIRADIDLGEVRAFDEICVTTARGNHAEVSFPEGVDVFVSNDDKKWVYLGDVLQGQMHDDGPYLVKRFCNSKLPASAKNVMLVIQPRWKHVFVDEIEIIDNKQIKQTINYNKAMDLEETKHFLSNKYETVFKKGTLLKLADKWSDLANSTFRSISNGRDFKARLAAVKRTLVDNKIPPEHIEVEKAENEVFKLNRLLLKTKFNQPLLSWRKDPWEVFIPTDFPQGELLVSGDKGLVFDVMKNGKSSDAFILTNNTDSGSTLLISGQSMVNARAAPEYRLYEVVPVITSNNDAIGDALKPIENGTVTLKSGESKQIWLLVSAKGSTPGEYFWRISVKQKDATKSTIVIPVKIKVWPATYPDQQSVHVNTWQYLNFSPLKDLSDKVGKDLLAHHTNVFTIHTSQLPVPIFEHGKFVKNDYTVFDKAMKTLSGGKLYLFYMFFNHKEWRTFGGRYTFMSETWKEVFRQWIGDWVHHLRKDGKNYDAFAFYPVDEPNSKTEAGYLLDTARLIKEIDPKIQVYTTLGSVNRYDYLKVAEVVDIYQVLVPEVTSPEVKTLKDKNKEIWSYTAVGGGKQASPLFFYRAQAWHAFQQNIRGIGFWAYADTGFSSTAWNDFEGRYPGYSVVYESNKSIISSKRWEAWREGIEDYELLILAREKLKTTKEKEEFMKQVAKTIAHIGNYQQFEESRRHFLSMASRDLP